MDRWTGEGHDLRAMEASPWGPGQRNHHQANHPKHESLLMTSWQLKVANTWSMEVNSVKKADRRRGARAILGQQHQWTMGHHKRQSASKIFRWSGSGVTLTLRCTYRKPRYHCGSELKASEEVPSHEADRRSSLAGQLGKPRHLMRLNAMIRWWWECPGCGQWWYEQLLWTY